MTVPANQSTPVTGAKSGVSAYGNQDTTGSSTVQIAGQSIDKGGMRGLGLIAVALTEAKLKYDSVALAEDYYKQNKKEFDAFVAIHEPAIAQTVAEAMSPTANPAYQYDIYASVPAGIAKAALADEQWFETRRRSDRYAIGVQKRIDYEFALMRTHGVVAGWNIGTRYEINYADEHNNRRFDRKIAASNIGIGIGNIVQKGLAASISNLSSARDSLGDSIATIGNGLAAGGGYKQGREIANKRIAAKTSEAKSSGVG